MLAPLRHTAGAPQDKRWVVYTPRGCKSLSSIDSYGPVRVLSAFECALAGRSRQPLSIVGRPGQPITGPGPCGGSSTSQRSRVDVA
jgi:hypothetical protein